MTIERQTKINEQIAEAGRVIKKFDYVSSAIVLASKLNSRSKNEYFGFRFIVNESCKVGDTLKEQDGSISKIEAIVTPNEGQ